MSRLRAMLKEASAEIGGRKREFFWLSGMVVAYTITYAMSRPPIESLFLGEYGHERLPEAWLVVTLVMLASVEIYSRWVGRFGALRLFATTALVSSAILVVLLTLRRSGVENTTYALYVWKDVYIIVLVEAFWTTANILFPIRSARWIYGFFCAAGAIGGLTGNLVAGVLAGWLGSLSSLWGVCPLLLVGAAVAIGFQRHQSQPLTTGRRTGSGLWGVPKLLGKSPYLAWMAVLIATTQVVITLIDYEFNGAVRAAYPEGYEDQRTQVISAIYAAIGVSALFFQVATGPILRLIGVAGGLMSVPILLGSIVGAYLMWPVFALMAAMKIGSKSLDYSLFRAAKEILYIPLGQRDKTEGKALVDMLIYRSTKGGTYPMFHGIAGGGVWSVPQVTLAFIGLWVGITLVLAQRFKQQTADRERPARPATTRRSDSRT